MHKDSTWGLRTRRSGLGANDAMGAHLVGTKAHRGKGSDPVRRRLLVVLNFAGRVLKVATQGGLVTCRFRRVTGSLPDNGRMYSTGPSNMRAGDGVCSSGRRAEGAADMVGSEWTSSGLVGPAMISLVWPASIAS